MTIDFTRMDLGCHVDGALGDVHLVQRLAAMVSTYNKPLSDTLFDAMTIYRDDLDELIYEAIDLLREHTADGLCWCLEAGDLLLIEAEAVS